MPLIAIDGIKVAYEDAGAGLPLVFIPGLVGTREWFKNQSTGLRARYKVISYDLRTAANHRQIDVDLLTEDLSHLMSALRLDSAVIAGHSYGAMIAQRFAITHRERTDGLILMSAFPNLKDVSSECIVEWMTPGATNLKTPIQSVLKKLFRVPSPTVAESEDLEWLAAHSVKLSRAKLDQRINLIRQFDSTEWLPEIEVPTLVIAGAHDQEPFLHGAQTLYEQIASAELEVIEEGDHYCFYTRHDLVNTLIDEFVTDRLAGL